MKHTEYNKILKARTKTPPSSLPRPVPSQSVETGVATPQPFYILIDTLSITCASDSWPLLLDRDYLILTLFSPLHLTSRAFSVGSEMSAPSVIWAKTVYRCSLPHHWKFTVCFSVAFASFNLYLQWWHGWHFCLSVVCNYKTCIALLLINLRCH